MDIHTENGRVNYLKRFFSMREFGVLIALIILCVLLAIASPYFLKVTNLFNVLRQLSLITILAVGQCLIIILGRLDLSIGTVMCLMGVIAAQLSLLGMPAIVILVVVLLCGMGMGAVNGVLVTKFGVNAFIVTLGTQYIARSLALLITGGMPTKFSNGLNMLGSGYVGPVPISVIVMAGVIAVGAVITKKTLIGRNIFIVGSNEKAAKLSGIRSSRLVFFSFVFMGFLCGIAGIILAGTLKSADPTSGLGYELEAIAAVIIGGTSLTGGRGTILGVVIGAALMGVLKNGFVLLGITAYWQTFVLGAVIIAAVLIDSLKNRNDA
ncbi:monosaccharide-transporting ATPase [Clostridia bacterium]|nr:monosaccharide-transporting ATPase [Clostridia bacterium]